MNCESCGVGAETRHVAFYQNIGIIIIRISNTAEGNFCKSCIHRFFWSMTTVNLLLGWWGIISFILNPFLILNNVFRYLGCLGMKAPDQTPAGVERSEDARSPAPRAAADDGGCYLCGKPLRPEERGSRVCQACS
jgi:hypothetical protein